MVRPEDFAKCCRCCLLTLGPMNSIFGTCLDTMLGQLTGLLVIKDDEFPQQMCSRCVIKLSSAFNFYSMVRNSHKALEEVLQKVQIESKPQFPSYEENKVEVELVPQIDEPPVVLHRSETVKLEPQPSSQLHCVEPETHLEELPDPEDSYQCSQCNHNSQSEEDLKMHLQTHVASMTNSSEQLEAPKHLCSFCGKKFRLRTSLCKHLRLHRGNFFQCEYCDKRFVEATTLKVHLARHGAAGARMACACGRAFGQRASLRRHARAHRPRDRLPCPDCPSTFLHKFSLSKHRACAHIPAQCTICDQQFAGTKALKVHMKTHNKKTIAITHATTGYPLPAPVNVQAVTVEFLCLLCSGKYPSKESLETTPNYSKTTNISYAGNLRPRRKVLTNADDKRT